MSRTFLKLRQQVPVQVPAVVLEGRIPNVGFDVLQKGLRQALEAHLLGGSPVG
jgi:hypothetical protein